MLDLIKDCSRSIIDNLFLANLALVSEEKCLGLGGWMSFEVAIFVLLLIGLALVLSIPQLLGDRERQHELYRLTLSNVSDAVFITDRTGAFTLICPNVDNIFGYSSQEVETFGNIAKLLGEDIFDSQELENLGEIQNIEVEIRDKKGKKHNLLVNLKRVSIDKGCYLYTCHDVTELKQTEEELQQYRYHLEQLVEIRTAELAKVNEQLQQEIRERQQTEDALRQSEERLRSIFNNVSVGIAVIDKNGYIIAANDADCRFLGYLQTELVGQHFREFTYPKDLDIDINLYGALVRGESESYAIDKRYVRKDGEIVWGRLSVALIRDENGQPKYTTVVCEDINDRKQAENALRESQQQLATIAANIPGVVFRYVIHTDGKVSIPYISAGLQELIGISGEEMMAHPETIFDRVHCEDRLQLEKAIAISAKTLTPLNQEYRLISTSGKEKWVRAIARLHRLNNGDIVLDGLSLDITAYKFAEEAMLESEATNRALISGIPDALFRIHRDGTFLDFVPSSEVDLLLSPSEFLGKKITEVFPMSMAVQLMDAVKKALESGNTQIYEYQLLIGGCTKDYEARIVVSGKAKDRVLGIVRDISDRKQAERALQAQIHRTELILQTALDGFCMVSIDGCFINVNPAFCAILGYSQAELLGTEIGDIEVIENSQEKRRHIENIFQFGSAHFETKLRCKDGQIVDIEASSTFAEIGETRFIFSFVRDITSRKQIEASLRLQAQIIDQIHDSVILTDLDGYIASWNRGAERLYGYLPTEAIGKHILFLYEPGSEYILQQQVIQPLLEKGKHDLEMRACKKTGENIWVHLSLSLVKDCAGNAIGMIGYSIDISDRKQAEEALRESEERFRQLAENLTDVFWMMTADKKQILYVSPAFESMWGYTRESLYQNLIGAFHPEDRDRVVAAFLKIPDEKYDEEYRIIKPDGTIRWLRSRAFPIQNDRGEVYRIAGISQDITEQKQAEQALRESQHFIEKVARTTPFILYVYDLIKDFNIYANRQVIELLGYTPKQIQEMGSNFPEIILHPEDLAAHQERIQRWETTKDGDILNCELRLRHCTGVWRIFQCQETLFARTPDGLPKQILGAAIDITDRKLAEEKLCKSEASLAEAQKLAHLGSWELDVVTQKMIWSEETFRIFGVNPKNFTPTYLQLRQRIHRDDTDKWEKAIQQLVADGKNYEIEFRIVRPNGSIRHLFSQKQAILNEEGQVIRKFGTLLDITDRKQAEEERDRFFNLSLDLLGIAGFDGYFKRVNPAVSTILGYTAEEFLSKPFVNFIHPSDRAATLAELQKLIAGEPTLYFEKRYRCKDGTYKWLTWTAFPVPAARLIYTVARDTNERRKAEEALRESREKYRVLFEIFPIGITISDELGNIINANPASEEILGIPKKEHTNTTLDGKEWQIIRPDGTPMPTDEFVSVRALKENRLIENVELGIVKSDNKITWLNVTAAPIPLQGYGVAVAYVDITERKQAQEALRQREKEFRTLAENTPDIISRFDKELRHVYVNPAVEKASGLPPQVFIGKTNRELGLPEPQISYREKMMRQVFATGSENVIEFDYPTPSGLRYFQTRIVPELAADGTVEFLLCTTRDITDLKQMEESLRMTQARLQHLLSASPAIIYSCKASGEYDSTFMSDNVTAIQGYEAREFIEDSHFWINRIHPEDIDRILTELLLLNETGHQIHEYRFQHKDGNYRWMYDELQLVRDANGNPLEIVGSRIDISDRKQAETTLKYRAALQQLIGDISTNFLNLPSAEIDRGINQALQALGEFIAVDRTYVFMFAEGGAKIHNIHHWCVPGVELPIHRFQGLSVENFPFASQILKKGEPLTIGCLADLPDSATEKAEFEFQKIQSLLFVPLVVGGSVVGLIGCDTVNTAKTWTEDRITLLKIVGEIIVTAFYRRHFEQQLEQRAADLARSNAELEQFAYVASHDLQEPLRMVASYTQLLAKRYSGQLDAKADKYIAYAVDGAIRMQQLIEDLLKYSRVGTKGKEFAAVNCQKVFATAVKNLEVAIQESGAVVICNSLPTVMGDDIQLVQLFQNLIGNAIKYRGERSPVVNVQAQRQQRAWLFSVSDNGIGIASQHAERIFQVFQRLHTREEYPGTGIGLAICKKIVERHGGRIWLRSELGQGTTFYFTIAELHQASAK